MIREYIVRLDDQAEDFKHKAEELDLKYKAEVRQEAEWIENGSILEQEIKTRKLKAEAAQFIGNTTEAREEWYLCDCLRALKRIMDSGSCNECRHKTVCKVCPNWGDLSRYNCPFFMKEGEAE